MIYEKTKKKKITVPCQVCFKFVPDLARHMKRHEQPLYNCSICNSPFTRKDNLKRHIKMQHHDIQIFKPPKLSLP